MRDYNEVFRRPERNRLLYAAAVIGTVLAGLASRRFPLLGKYPGDALWALMAFFALGCRESAAHISSCSLSGFHAPLNS